MRCLRFIVIVMSSLSGIAAYAEPSKVYLNQNLGFNIEGFKYTQKTLPCDIPKHFVRGLMDQAHKQKIPMEAVGTAEKVRNGVIPVLAIDIEQLALGKPGYNYSKQKDRGLPMIQTTAAVVRGKDVVTSKHTCAYATLNEFSTSSSVLDLGSNTTVCGAIRRCIGDLSKDIMTWVSSELKK